MCYGFIWISLPIYFSDQLGFGDYDLWTWNPECLPLSVPNCLQWYTLGHQPFSSGQGCRPKLSISFVWYLGSVFWIFREEQHKYTRNLFHFAESFGLFLPLVRWFSTCFASYLIRLGWCRVYHTDFFHLVS